MSMIPPRMRDVPLWRTEGLYRKEMKRRFSQRVYGQRAKAETVFSVVKRTMRDEMRSVRTKGVNNEIRVRMIAYNAMRTASSHPATPLNNTPAYRNWVGGEVLGLRIPTGDT
jgi:hypothetical protein